MRWENERNKRKINKRDLGGEKWGCVCLGLWRISLAGGRQFFNLGILVRQLEGSVGVSSIYPFPRCIWSEPSWASVWWAFDWGRYPYHLSITLACWCAGYCKIRWWIELTSCEQSVQVGDRMLWESMVTKVGNKIVRLSFSGLCKAIKDWFGPNRKFSWISLEFQVQASSAEVRKNELNLIDHEWPLTVVSTLGKLRIWASQCSILISRFIV